MKLKSGHINLIFYGVVVVILVTILVAAFRVPLSNQDHYFKPLECEREGQTESDLRKIHKMTPSEYLSKGYYCDPVLVLEDLAILDSVLGGELEAEAFLFPVLTDSLKVKYKAAFNRYDMQVFMNMLAMAESYLVFRNDKKFRYFFVGVHRYWFDQISNTLEDMLLVDPNVKFDPDFRILVSRCAQNDYHIAIEFSWLDKVTAYLIEGRFSYVWNRFWLRTSTAQQFVVITFFSVTLILYIFGLKWVINKLLRKIRKK